MLTKEASKTVLHVFKDRFLVSRNDRNDNNSYFLAPPLCPQRLFITSSKLRAAKGSTKLTELASSSKIITNFQTQFFQLCAIKSGRRVNHDIATRIVFREGDEVTDSFLPA